MGAFGTFGTNPAKVEKTLATSGLSRPHRLANSFGMKPPSQRIYAVALLILAAAFPGCQSIRGPKGLLERQTGGAGLTTGELRAIMDDLVIQCACRIELAADQIIARTDETEVHKNALLWKSNGISSCFQAATGRDPLAAFLNIWILNKQSLELFERQDALFGDEQPIAIETVSQLEVAFDQVLEKIGKDFPIGEVFATRFAEDYPIENLYFDRASIAEHYTDYIEKVNIGNRDLKQVVGDLDGQIDQFQKLSALYAEFLPKQARWQAELLALEAIPDGAIEAVLVDLNSATESARQVTDVVTEIPFLVERERIELKRTITDERTATVAALSDLQSKTVDDLQKERRIIIDELQNERVAIFDDVAKERVAVLQAVNAERIAATQDFTELSQDLFEQFDRAADQKLNQATEKGMLITDYVFKKATQLGIILGGFLFVALWFSKRRRNTDFQSLEFPHGQPPSRESFNNSRRAA